MPPKKIKSFKTMCNIHPPFEVSIDYENKTIEIKSTYNELTSVLYYNYSNLLIDKNTHTRYKKKDNIGPMFLAELEPGKYMYITQNVFEFTINDTITDFYSAYDGNDIPWPYAISDKNVYLLYGSGGDNCDKYIYFYDKSLVSKEYILADPYEGRYECPNPEEYHYYYQFLGEYKNKKIGRKFKTTDLIIMAFPF